MIVYAFHGVINPKSVGSRKWEELFSLFSCFDAKLIRSLRNMKFSFYSKFFWFLFFGSRNKSKWLVPVLNLFILIYLYDPICSSFLSQGASFHFNLKENAIFVRSCLAVKVSWKFHFWVQKQSTEFHLWTRAFF